jgi:hypothetical protein
MLHLITREKNAQVYIYIYHINPGLIRRRLNTQRAGDMISHERKKRVNHIAHKKRKNDIISRERKRERRER